MSVSSPAPRRVKSPSWLDVRLVIGVVLVLASVLLGARVISGANHRVGVLAVTRDLAAGTLLSRADVTIVRVQLPGGAHDRYLSSDTDIEGKQLNRPLSDGELLPAAAMGTAAALTTVVVPFPGDAAPALSPGQRIEIWLASKACVPVVLLADVTVQDVRAATGGSFSASTGQNVVLSVPPTLAGRLVAALARDGGVIRAGILTGPPQAGANDALPELDACPGRPPRAS